MRDPAYLDAADINRCWRGQQMRQNVHLQGNHTAAGKGGVIPGSPQVRFIWT